MASSDIGNQIFERQMRSKKAGLLNPESMSDITA